MPVDIFVPQFRKGFDIDEVNIQNRLAINKSIVQAIADNPVIVIESAPNNNYAITEITLEDIKEFLRTYHTTLWGSFSIHSEKGLDKAARWLQAELNAFDKHYRKVLCDRY